MMVLGSLLATVHQPHATMCGLLVQLASQLCEVLQCTLMQHFLQRLGFEAWDAGYYLSPAIAACCLLPSLILEWPHVIANHNVGLLFRQVPLLLLSGSIGIVVNFSAMLVIKFTSSLLAKLLVIARSAFLVLIFIAYGEDFTWLQVVGYIVTLGAFAAYSLLRSREMEQEQQAPPAVQTAAEDSPLGQGPMDSDDDRSVLYSPTSSVQAMKEQFPDLTSAMFWFAICVVAAGAYQAAVVGDLPSCGYGMFHRELTALPPLAVPSVGIPPTPYLEPITAGTRALKENPVDGSGGVHTAGALSVETRAKVLYLEDGRFLLHSRSTRRLHLAHRSPKTLLTSSWIISSKQFGTVYLSSLDNQGSMYWLTCDLALVPDATEACLLWMTASTWRQWRPSDDGKGEYIFRRQGDQDRFLAATGSGVTWSRKATPIRVDNWLPEACPLVGMSASPKRYEDALGEVTFTMTTFFQVYARSIMFRQALSSVFSHLQEQHLYVKEFLVINDWYAGRSLDFNGILKGPDVEETRREMLAFFPGCVGMSVVEAHARPKDQDCTFIFKGRAERGQPKALNILLDLMTTKFWIHFEDDHVFYQDVYISWLLAPIYDDPRACWGHSRGSKDEDAGCLKIAGVRLGAERGLDGIEAEDTFKVKDYRVPDVLWDDEYVKELLEHGGSDDDASHGWGKFQGVGAVWPLFSLRPMLHNLTYIKSLQAPLFYGGRPGRFCEEDNITVWESGGKTYRWKWNIELEFGVRWARSGATLATLSPGACMRDVSNGISSFEQSSEYRW